MASFLPALTGMAGPVYAVAAMAMGLAFLAVGVRFVLSRSAWSARSVVIASVVYLPLLFLVLMADKTPL
jgi:protoheme IX farnesyltransferase